MQKKGKKEGKKPKPKRGMSRQNLKEHRQLFKWMKHFDAKLQRLEEELEYLKEKVDILCDGIPVSHHFAQPVD